MRKIFGGSLILSLVGVAVLGSVFAWTLSDSVESSNDVGSAGFQLNFANNGNLLGPNDVTTRVGGGGGGLMPGSDFSVVVPTEGGQVEILTVAPNDGLCTINDFEGIFVNEVPGYEITEETPNPGDWEYSVFIKTLEDAPVECMNKTVTYRITVDAETVANITNTAP